MHQFMGTPPDLWNQPGADIVVTVKISPADSDGAFTVLSELQ